MRPSGLIFFEFFPCFFDFWILLIFIVIFGWDFSIFIFLYFIFSFIFIFSKFLSTCYLTDATDYITDATDWNQIKPPVQLRLGMDCLAIWLVRTQTQVMSPSSASMSLASARRSTFRPETLVSCSSTTLRSPPGRVPPLLKLCSLGASLTKMGADSDSLPGRTSIKETCADIDRETVVSSLFGSMSRRREIVIKTLCKHRETGKISTKPLNGRLNWSREEKNWLSKDFSKLRQTWRSSTGRREIQILFFMRSQRLQLQLANQWADQAQRDKNKFVWRIGNEEQTLPTKSS